MLLEFLKHEVSHLDYSLFFSCLEEEKKFNCKIHGMQRNVFKYYTRGQYEIRYYLVWLFWYLWDICSKMHYVEGGTLTDVSVSQTCYVKCFSVLQTFM